MSIITPRRGGLRTGRLGFTLLEWLFSNLVVSRRGGDVFVPPGEEDFSASQRRRKGVLRKSGGMIFQTPWEDGNCKTRDCGISQRSREFCGRTRPLPKGEEIGGPALEGDEHHR